MTETPVVFYPRQQGKSQQMNMMRDALKTAFLAGVKQGQLGVEDASAAFEQWLLMLGFNNKPTFVTIDEASRINTFGGRGSAKQELRDAMFVQQYGREHRGDPVRAENFQLQAQAAADMLDRLPSFEELQAKYGDKNSQRFKDEWLGSAWPEPQRKVQMTELSKSDLLHCDFSDVERRIREAFAVPKELLPQGSRTGRMTSREPEQQRIVRKTKGRNDDRY